MDIFLYFLFGCLLTAISYMAFPLIRLLSHRGKFEKKRARRIALWNSVIVGGFFLIATAIYEGSGVWSAGPSVLYYWINCALLTDRNDNLGKRGYTAGGRKANALRKRIKKLILKSIGNNLSVYSDHISVGLNSGQSDNDIMCAARKAYYDAVFEDVVRSFTGNSYDVLSRTTQLLHNPSLCGYPYPIDFENHGATGGALCAVLFYTLTQSVAGTEFCKEIDTRQSLTLEHYHRIMFPTLPYSAPISEFTTIDIDEPVSPTVVTPNHVVHVNVSPANEQPRIYGNYNIYGSDMAIVKPEDDMKVSPTMMEIEAKVLAREKAYAKIDKFHDYYQRGIITEEEYNKSREMVLQTLNYEGE